MTVLVEIDVGASRCGVQPGPDAVALATRIAASKHLIFGGIQAYHGSAQHKRTPAERRTLISGAIDASRRTVEQLRQQGLDCAIVGGAGTGTCAIESNPASTPKCKLEATFSWMPTMPETRARPARRSARSGIRCSCCPRS